MMQYGRTPLDAALRNGHGAIAKLLLEVLDMHQPSTTCIEQRHDNTSDIMSRVSFL